MKKFIDYINGHKTQITAVITLLIGFITTRGYIAKDTSELLLAIMTLLVGGSIYHHEVKKANAKKK